MRRRLSNVLLFIFVAAPLSAQVIGPLDASKYAFQAKSPGGSLTAAVPATISLTAAMGGCPRGITDGAGNWSPAYVSGGTGTAEIVAITGGSCTSGASAGTLTFTPANSHSGAWTIQAVNGGLPGADNDLGSAAGEIDVTKLSLFTTPLLLSHAARRVGCGVPGDTNAHGTMLKEANGANLNPMISVSGYGVGFENCDIYGNQENNGSATDGISDTAAKFHIYNTNVYDFKQDNLVLGPYSQDTRCTNSGFFIAVRDGISLQASLPHTPTDFFSLGCESVNNARYQFSSGPAGGLHILGGDFSGRFYTATAWQANHAYSLGDVINDGTYLQVVNVPGTSQNPGPPTFNATWGGATVDGGVTWGNIGTPGYANCMNFDGTGASVNLVQLVGIDINPCPGTGVRFINANVPMMTGSYITSPGQNPADPKQAAVWLTSFGQGVFVGNFWGDGQTACSGSPCMKYGAYVESESHPSLFVGNYIFNAQTEALHLVDWDEAVGNLCDPPGQICNQTNMTYLWGSKSNNTADIIFGHKAAITTVILHGSVEGDSQDRWGIFADGSECWGPGSAGCDTTWHRTGTSQMQLDGKLELLSNDNLSATNIFTAYANNGGAAVGIGYESVRAIIGNGPLKLDAAGSGVVSVGDTSSGGVNIAAGGGDVTFPGSGVWKSTGYVGIGGSPSYLLDVNGDINVSAAGHFRFNGTAGVNCGPGTPSAGFTVVGGLVTVC